MSVIVVDVQTGEVTQRPLTPEEVAALPPEPAPVVPASVTMRQARLALLRAGLLDDVDAAIAAIPDPVQRKAAQIEWEYAAVIERNSSLVTVLSAQLGLDAATLDSLFLAGSTL